jgi:uncharacterized surface protein with fasciclin (FAS1) repeats
LDTIFINTITSLISKTKKVNMKYISNINRIGFLLAVSAVLLLSCNKEPEQFTETFPVPTGSTLEQTLLANVNDSLYNRIVLKGGMSATLNDSSLTHTLFVPDNNAVIASFGGSLAAANATIAALPPESCAGIVKYSMLPQALTTAQFIHSFPNLQEPTDIILDTTNPLVRMTAFPSKNSTTGMYYYNNVPLTATDALAANGVIHHVAFIATPPIAVLKTAMSAEPNLTYFLAAVQRGDSGQVGTARFDSLLNYAVTNMTVFAPDDAAFQTVIFGMVYAYVLQLTGDPATANQQATLAVASGPAIFQNPALYGILPAASVRGIIAYHLLASINPFNGEYEPNIRAFAENFEPTPTLHTTLINAAYATHPGLLIQETFTGPIAIAGTLTGLGTFPPGGAPYSGAPATVTAGNKHCVNGVYHIIDKVLFPQ